MKKNIGSIDRALRIVAGVVILSLTMVGPQTPLGWLGIVPLLTGLFGFCPLYRVVGVSSCTTGGVDTCKSC